MTLSAKEQAMPAARKVLHVGCGSAGREKLPQPFKGGQWREVRLDINPKVKPDIVASMTSMPMVASGSMDGVFSSHNLEHLYHHQIAEALGEFRRVMKQGGMLVITLPDLQAVAAYIADGRLENALYQSSAGAISPIDILYGFRRDVEKGNHFMAHKTGFTAVSLANHLKQAGFCNIVIQREWVNLWAVATHLPEKHPARKEAVVVENRNITGPDNAPLPVWYQQQLQMQGGKTRADELDAPPRLWKPLGLKNSLSL